MKTIGIMGGMSDKATGEYYRLINAGINTRLGGWNTAEVIINSANFGNIERFVRNDQWDEAGAYLNHKALALQRAGADMLLCVSNTMHRVSDRFMDGVTIPFIHIADPTGRAMTAGHIKKAAILGTKPIMAADYMKVHYRDQFGIDVFAPQEEEQVEIDSIIFDELVKAQFLPQSKARYLDVVDKLYERGAEGVILGCTEICMLINQQDRPDVPMFDTTSLHASAAVDLALQV